MIKSTREANTHVSGALSCNKKTDDEEALVK